MNNIDINKPIPYRWQWKWIDMPGVPVVNPLMKAIIERNIPEMYALVQRGASLKALDKYTLKRVLWQHIKDVRIFKFFVDQGARYYWRDLDNISSMIDECTNDIGYSSGTVAWAYYCGAYDVFELLLSCGYINKYICFNGAQDKTTDLIKVIFERNDVNAVKLLMEYGLSRSEIENKYNENYYYDNPCYQYIINNIVFHRKSYVLNNRLFYQIPQPELIKPGLFNKKKVLAYNEALMEDYRDQLRVQQEFMSRLTPEQKRFVLDQPKRDKFMMDAMKRVANSL